MICNCACHSSDSQLQRLIVRKQELRLLKDILDSRISILRAEAQQVRLRRELQVKKNNCKQYSLRQFSEFQYYEQDRQENTLLARTRFQQFSDSLPSLPTLDSLGQEVLRILQINSLLLNQLQSKHSFQNPGKQSSFVPIKISANLPKESSSARKCLKKQNVLPIERDQFWVLNGESSLKERERKQDSRLRRGKIEQLLDRVQQLLK